MNPLETDMKLQIMFTIEPNQQSHNNIFCHKHLPPGNCRHGDRTAMYLLRQEHVIHFLKSTYVGQSWVLWTTIPRCRRRRWPSAPCPPLRPVRHQCDGFVATGYVTEQLQLSGWHVVHQAPLGKASMFVLGVLFIALPDLFGQTSQR